MKVFSIVLALCFAFSFNLDAQDKNKKKKKGTEETTFDVSMTCNNCKQKIEKNIAWEEGVKDLEVDLKKKTVKLEYDPKKTSEDKLKKAIKGLGFETVEKQVVDEKTDKKTESKKSEHKKSEDKK